MSAGPFAYREGRLFCEGVPLVDIAAQHGTPCYVYSATRILANLDAYETAFAEIPHLIAYSLKANSNGAVLRLLAGASCGADVVSGGELARALAAGIPPERIVFAGVGKREEETVAALAAGIHLLNIESLPELETVAGLAQMHGTTARIAVRVNPGIDAPTHPHLMTGAAGSKFGLPPPRALAAIRRARELSGLDPVGLHAHIGSQIVSPSVYRDTFRVLLELFRTLEHEGLRLTEIDLGGGLGIAAGEPVPGPVELRDALAPLLDGFEGRLVLEPGRSIVGDAGVLLTRVVHRKSGTPRPFLVVDAGMNDLLRPALYGARHRLSCLVEWEAAERVDVVGPVCESADVLLRDWPAPSLSAGDLLAVRDVGAYGASMASRYNSRPLAPEVLVHGGEAFLVRRRETVADLVEHEQVPDFLSEPRREGG